MREFDRTPYLVQVMRHELFGVLNAVTMISGLLGERGRRGRIQPEDLVDLAARLGRQVERATAIVEHYADTVGASEEDEPAAADVARASELDRAVTAARAGARRRGLSLEGQIRLDGALGEAELAIERRSLRFVLDTVLEAALARAPSGGTVRLELEKDDDELCLRVRHGGGALTIDDLHIFEHRRAEAAELVDLAVSRRIMTDVGGDLAPDPDGFRIRLPLADA